ncbi:hypothetical protein BHM03_00057364 [Ensete ventricosum]|nr:hypothetical protein BHM03_00057364 [Ensete ventricosum]
MWARVKSGHWAGVRTVQLELVERLIGSSPKVSGACQELARSSSKVIGSLPGRRQEFAERRPRDSPEDRMRLSKSLSGGLVFAQRRSVVDTDRPWRRRLGEWTYAKLLSNHCKSVSSLLLSCLLLSVVLN